MSSLPNADLPTGSSPPAATRPADDGADARALRAAFAPATLSADCLRTLLDGLHRHQSPAGPLAIGPRQPEPAWWLLIEGRVVVGHTIAPGGMVESRTLEAGEWLDVASAWSGDDWIEPAVCSTEATLWAVPIERLLACCRLDVDFAATMGRVMALQARHATQARHEVTTVSVHSRVARWLLQQVAQSATNVTAILLRERKKSIAQQLEMAQETFSRALRRLADLGCIDVDGYLVTIRDLAGLQTIASQKQQHAWECP